MFELVLVACLSAAECHAHTYGATFPSQSACYMASQPLAAAWQAEHPDQRITLIVCREPKPKGIDL